MSPLSRWLGAILVLLSATSFGFMPLFGHWAKGVSDPMLLMLRFGIAAVILSATVLLRGESFPRGKVLLALLCMGAVGYFGESFLYFTALHHAPSGMVSLLLYTYPAIVTIISVACFKERLTPLRLIALILAVAGSALTAIPGLFAADHERVEPIGVILGLTCAASYAVYVLAGARLPKSVGPLPSSALVCTGTTIMYALVVAGRAINHPEPLPSTNSAWLGIVSLALVCTVIGVTTFLAGLALIGPIRASTLSAFEPVMTAAVGVIALGEKFSPIQVVGGSLIVVAAVLSARAQDPTPADAATATS